jgi:stage II sporulation protein M
MGKSNYIHSVLLLFLIGFFLGAVFYYLFQNSFSELINPFQHSLSSVSEEDYSLSYKMLQAIWNHGRFFLLFWLLSFTRIHRIYQALFLLYTGFCNGFRILFFVLGKGLMGIVWYLASLFPQSLLLVPLYLFSFLLVGERERQRKHKWFLCLGMLIVFFAASFLEARYNLSIMQKLS